MSAATVADISEVLAIGRAWDTFWVSHLGTTGAQGAAREDAEIRPLPDASRRRLNAAEFYVTPIARNRWSGQSYLPAVWAPSDAVVGKRVVEFGAGLGQLSRILGPLTRRYLAVESSNVAASIARSHAAGNVRVVHASERLMFSDLRGTFDTALSRNVVPHLNFTHALWTLREMRQLLRRGGMVYADFFSALPGSLPGTVFRAYSPQNSSALTAGYYYSDAEICALANILNLRVVSLEHQPSLLRAMVTLEVL